MKNSLTAITALIVSGLAVAADDGRELYVTYGCYQCHGYEGQGARMSGPRIAPEPLPYEAFAEAVRRPYGVMPAYSPNVLDERGLRRIYEFVTTIE